MEILDPCLKSVLSVDPTMLDPLPYQYILEQPPATRTFDDLLVQETQIIADCPTQFEYEVTLRDGSPLPAGFIASYDPVTKQVSAESSDRSYLD